MSGVTKAPPGPPLFTVLIPTMNRPALVKDAITSVLRQRWDDFELLVSDNSSDPAAREELSRFVAGLDDRVRLMHPPSVLNMPDHWEYAAKQATGEYVLVLTDRFVMRPSALLVLQRLIETSDARPEIIAWDAESRYDVSGKVLSPSCGGTTQVYDARALVAEFASCRDWRTRPLWSNRLPRGLNSAYSRALAGRVRAAHGRLYFPLSPDYTAAFMLLAYARNMTYADLPLYLSHGNAGNGLHFVMHGGEAYLRAIGDVELFPAYCLSQLSTSCNLVLRDLLFVKELTGAAFAAVEIDRAGFLLNNYREILYMQQVGSQRDLDALRAEWWSLVESSGEQTVREVRAGMAELAAVAPSVPRVRRWVVRSGVDRAYHAVRRAGLRVAARLRGEPLYANALDAAAGTDGVLRAEIPS